MSHLSLHSLLKVPTESYLSQLSWQDSPLYTETQQERRQSQSPLEPPSPAPGQQPVQVLELWEQYLDPSTGRSFYVNSITKERSWKPPRRARGRTASKVRQTGFNKFQEFLQAFKSSHVYIIWTLQMTWIARNSNLTIHPPLRAAFDTSLVVLVVFI